MRTIFFFLALLLASAVICPAREAGWVPLPKEPWKPPAGTHLTEPTDKARPHRQGKAQKAGDQKNMAKGETVYDRQPPVTEAELSRFLTLLPQFRAWSRKMREEAHPIVTAAGKADFLYSQRAADWVQKHSFAPVRFFCIMGRMAACVVIIEEGNDLKATRPRDMPEVSAAEVSIARRHLGELLTAGGTAGPLN